MTSVRKAARLLREAQRPLLVVGSQAMLEVGITEMLHLGVSGVGMPTYLVDRATGLLPPDRCASGLLSAEPGPNGRGHPVNRSRHAPPPPSHPPCT